MEDEDTLLRSILEVSVRNNAAVAVTGMLLRHCDHFIQALEGSAAAVEAIYRRVQRDPRHQDIKLIQDATPRLSLLRLEPSRRELARKADAYAWPPSMPRSGLSD